MPEDTSIGWVLHHKLDHNLDRPRRNDPVTVKGIPTDFVQRNLL